MKLKSLQFGKAMSAALFVLLLVVVGLKNALAQTQVATLQHGDDVSVFYGMNAFVEAYTIAETGDVVTLSSGTFSPIDINKAITLRGAGALQDTVSGIMPTILSGQIVLNVENESAFLTIEGVFFTGSTRFVSLNHPNFIKCMFHEFDYNFSNDNSLTNAQFVNCMIENCNFTSNTSADFINCVIRSTGATENANLVAYNSIFISGVNYHNLSAYNCIIGQLHAGNYGNLDQNSIAYNCIGIKIPESYEGPLYYTSQTFNCMSVDNYSEVFESFDGEFSFEEPYFLKDEIVIGFLGTDGTQVGIYGGIMPYSNRPTYMVLKRCNVANKSTIDGKLSVDIEVITEGE
jgi:hypothetical protein